MLNVIIQDIATNAIAILFWVSLGAYGLRRIAKAN